MAKKEFSSTIRDRYQHAAKRDKGRILETLLEWTSQHGIEFTRSGAYRSNYQA